MVGIGRSVRSSPQFCLYAALGNLVAELKTHLFEKAIGSLRVHGLSITPDHDMNTPLAVGRHKGRGSQGGGRQATIPSVRFSTRATYSSSLRLAARCSGPSSRSRAWLDVRCGGEIHGCFEWAWPSSCGSAATGKAGQDPGCDPYFCGLRQIDGPVAGCLAVCLSFAGMFITAGRDKMLSIGAVSKIYSKSTLLLLVSGLESAPRGRIILPTIRSMACLQHTRS